MAIFPLLAFDFLVACLLLRVLAPRFRIDGPNKWLGPLIRRDGTSRWGRPVIVVVCALVTYATTAAIFGAGFYLRGEPAHDAYIDVIPGSPAEAAGVLDEDTIKSIDGVEITRYEDVAPVLQETRGERILLGVRRMDETLVIPVTPAVEGGERRIGVKPRNWQPTPPRNIGWRRAVKLGAVAPVVYVRSAVDELGHDGPVVGPIAMVLEATKADVVIRVGELKTFVWPLSLLASLYLVLRRGRAPKV